MDPLPPYLKELFTDSQFMQKIRFYNASFSFISFNATSDYNLSKSNIYTFSINGLIHHGIGPLISEHGLKQQCAQIYIHDGQQEISRQKYSNDLDLIILKRIKLMLQYDCNNPFLSKFQFASNRLKICPSLQLTISIITDKTVDKRI